MSECYPEFRTTSGLHQKILLSGKVHHQDVFQSLVMTLDTTVINEEMSDGPEQQKVGWRSISIWTSRSLKLIARGQAWPSRDLFYRLYTISHSHDVVINTGNWESWKKKNVIPGLESKKAFFPIYCLSYKGQKTLWCYLGDAVCLSAKRQRKPTKKILESSIEAEPIPTPKKKVCVILTISLH